MNKKRQKTSNNRRETIRAVEYFISGGAFFWSGYLTFFISDQIFHMNLWWAKLTANMVGWIINYLLQRYWVFNSSHLKKHQTEVTQRYITLTVANFLIDYAIVWGLRKVGITPYIGQFFSAGFFTGWNYLWYRFWVFPQHAHRHKRISTV